MARILINNGRVWDGEKFLFADILTEGKAIIKIEKIYQISNTGYRCVLTAADGQVIFID